MLIFITEMDTQQSIAVHKDNILYIRDFAAGPKIVFIDGSYLIVNENYLDLVSRISHS
jgi:hypothetical protein